MNIGLFCVILLLVIAFVDYYLKNAKQLDKYVYGIVSGKYIKSNSDNNSNTFSDSYYLTVQYLELTDTNESDLNDVLGDLEKAVNGDKSNTSLLGRKKVKEIIVSKDIYDKIVINDKIPIAIDKNFKLF